jgi:catechol 2,3-dioxygenase-like lactoylglutathione lyase family enzyme
MEITRVIFQTSSLKEQLDFYSNVLELSTGIKSENKITIGIGSTELVFEQVSGADPFYHFAINIPCNKIEEAKNWTSTRTKLIWMQDYKSEVADFINWHAKSVYFYDPAGNILELIARFDLDNKTDKPFSSAQFLSVSEVGLVIKENEMEKGSENLLKKYELSYFEKQPPLPQFKAIGDDDGLFIVVPEKRNWYPTTRPCGIFPMEVQFENEGKEYVLNS